MKIDKSEGWWLRKARKEEEGDRVVGTFTPRDSWGPRWVHEGLMEPSESYPGVEGPVVAGPVVEPPVRPQWPAWDYFQGDPGDEDDKD